MIVFKSIFVYGKIYLWDEDCDMNINRKGLEYGTQKN